MCKDKFPDLTEKMTTLTRNLWDQAVNSDMSLSEAVDALRKNANVRTLRSTLTKYSGIESETELRNLLRTGLQAHTPDAVPDSIRRRVSGWMGKAGRSLSKETAIELAYILKLDVETADEFISELTDEGFHWRDPQELAYIFGLNHGMSFPEAAKLAGQMAEAAEKSAAVDETPFTYLIRDEAKALGTPQELLDFAARSGGSLGQMHQTAYHMFMNMIDILRNPDGSNIAGSEENAGKFTVEEVLHEYLFRDQVPANEKSVVNPIANALIQSWPTQAQLFQMRSKNRDVTRKVLILLFLATDGEPIRPDDPMDEYNDDIWLDEVDDDERFRSAFTRLNTMLADCGFRRIDPRRPFDWMVLYCLCGADALEMDDTIRNFLEIMLSPPDDGNDE